MPTPFGKHTIGIFVCHTAIHKWRMSACRPRTRRYMALRRLDNAEGDKQALGALQHLALAQHLRGHGGGEGHKLSGRYNSGHLALRLPITPSAPRLLRSACPTPRATQEYTSVYMTHMSRTAQ